MLAVSQMSYQNELTKQFFHRTQDITRIDHVLDFWFPDVTTAPAFVRWKFVLHFETRQKVKHGFNGGEPENSKKNGGGS